LAKKLGANISDVSYLVRVTQVFYSSTVHLDSSNSSKPFHENPDYYLVPWISIPGVNAKIEVQGMHLQLIHVPALRKTDSRLLFCKLILQEKLTR
jgi:hypothetical protein